MYKKVLAVMLLCCSALTGCGKNDEPARVNYVSYTAKVHIDLEYGDEVESYRVDSNLSLQAGDTVRHYYGSINTYFKDEVITESVDRYILTDGKMYDKINGVWYYVEGQEIGGIVVPDGKALIEATKDLSITSEQGVATTYTGLIDSATISSMLLGLEPLTTGIPTRINTRYVSGDLNSIYVDLSEATKDVKVYTIDISEISYSTEPFVTPQNIIDSAKPIESMPQSIEDQNSDYEAEAEANKIETMIKENYGIDLVYNELVNTYIVHYLTNFSVEELKSYLVYYDMEPVESKVALYIICSKVSDFADVNLKLTDEMQVFLNEVTENADN